MPAWLIAIFWKYGVPLLISTLQKMGAFNKAEALAGKAVVWAENNIQTYQEFPADKNGVTEKPPST